MKAYHEFIASKGPAAQIAERVDAILDEDRQRKASLCEN